MRKIAFQRSQVLWQIYGHKKTSHRYTVGWFSSSKKVEVSWKLAIVGVFSNRPKTIGAIGRPQPGKQ